MQQYLKLFLAAALSYGVVIGLMSQSAWLGILFGVGIGLAIAGIFGTLHHQAFNELKKEADRSVYQERQIEVDLPYAAAWALALDALKTLPRVKIRKLDLVNGVLEAQTGLNLLTFGERITIQLRPLDTETTLLELVSRPRWRTALIDYGRNLQHIRDLLLYLRHASAADALALERWLEVDALPEPLEGSLANANAEQ
jgi:hypothetical protein